MILREVPRFGLLDAPRSLTFGSAGRFFFSVSLIRQPVTYEESNGCLVTSPRENGLYFDPGRTHVVSHT